MRYLMLKAAVALAGTAMMAAAAEAADLGGNCCADLEEHIQELVISNCLARPDRCRLTAVLDPTSFAQEDNALRFIGSDISNILNGTLNGAFGNAPITATGPMNLSAAPEQSLENASGVSLVTTPGVWAAGFGGQAEYSSGPFTDNSHTSGGGLAGANIMVAPGVVAGAFLGGATNHFETERGKRIDTYYLLGGIYGRAVAGAMFFDAALTGGLSDNSGDRRLVSSSLIVRMARANYDGTFIMPEVRVGSQFNLGNGLTLIPALQVRYHWQHFDAYAESGTNLQIGERDLQSLEERIELGLQQRLGNGLSLTIAAGGVFYQRTGGHDIELGITGPAASLITPIDAAEAGGFAKAGISFDAGPGVNVFARGEYQWFEDMDAISGTIGLKAQF